MDVDASDIEDENNNDNAATKKSKHRKRKEYMHDDDGHVAARKKLAERILLSLTRPSYIIGLGPKPLRLENRTRLCYLLRRLVKQHHWVEASGVLSAYMKGTLNDTSPFKNRFKFWVLLELLKHVENQSINPMQIKNLYDIWSKKIGSIKNWPIESRYVVHLELMLFCLARSNAGDAYQIALCLEQEKVDIDLVSKIIMGLTFYKLWYSSIPKEFQWRDSDQFDLQENSRMEGTSFSNEVGQSDTVETHMADSQFQCDLDASVMNDRKISREVGVNEDTAVFVEDDNHHTREKPDQTFQLQGFYLNSEERQGVGGPFSNSGGLTQDTLHALGGLDLWLFPLRFSNEDSFEEFMYRHRNPTTDYYKNAVKYLEQALDSNPSASAALLPLIQLLLIGGQVDKALTTLEKQCYNSFSVLPIRLRAALLERFDRNNPLLLHSCLEDILKKDPTCHDALRKLIKIHQNGDYSLKSLLEMIALHLDATDAEYSIWRVFSSCFYKQSLCEKDCMSTCSIQNENGQGQHCSFNRTPKVFTEGISGKSWRLRCRWWLTRHFSNRKLESDIETGDLQLLTYKAACASYMYGQEISYVSKAYSHLEKENYKDLLLFLNEQKGNSFGFY
ncbi:uncharacterized protein LOC130727876 [Lotus japonicus]|uniref:uncharacterized protein LOC130727876 n=1 Tax=Lotus japonicus TaxID=34305 RepID=UPI00258D8D9D|nr:uncharacterized protein LOC130727876 [Lotus japonicus]